MSVVFWESADDVGVEYELAAKSAGGSIIQDMVANVLNVNGQVHFFQKLCSHYNGCAFNDDIDRCFTTFFNRKILMKNCSANSAFFEKMDDMGDGAFVAFEELDSDLAMFYDFKHGSSTGRISFCIDKVKTLKLKEFVGCHRKCVQNGECRVIYTKKKSSWDHQRSPLMEL